MIDEQNAIYLKNRWWFLKFEDRSTLVVNSAFSGAIGLSNEERVAVKASSFFLSLIIIQVPGFLKKVFRKFSSTNIFFKAGEHIDIKDTKRNPRTGSFIWSALVNTVGHRGFCLQGEQNYLQSQRNESVGSSELSFQLSTDPNLTVPVVSSHFMGRQQSVPTANKKLLFEQAQVNCDNDTTIPNPHLEASAQSTMPLIDGDEVNRLLGESPLQIDELATNRDQEMLITEVWKAHFLISIVDFVLLTASLDKQSALPKCNDINSRKSLEAQKGRRSSSGRFRRQ